MVNMDVEAMRVRRGATMKALRLSGESGCSTFWGNGIDRGCVGGLVKVRLSVIGDR